MNESPTTIAVDVGNTAVKLCYAKAGQPEFKAFVLRDPDWAETAVDWVLQHSSGSGGERRAARWLLASVQRRASEQLQRAVADRLPEAKVQLVSHRDIPVAKRVQHPGRVGVDRLLGAYAAYRQLGGPVIVVDAGSAITVDWVESDGGFCGGVILPGLRLQAESLAAGTDALPAIGWLSESQLKIPASNTHDAILAGILIGAAAAIDAFIDRYQQPLGNPVPVVLSGGDAMTLTPHLQRKHHRIDNLVCRGLLELPISKGTCSQTDPLRYSDVRS